MSVPKPKSLKILVVEDREEDFLLLKVLLHRPQVTAAYELDWASSLDEGFAKLETQQYDVGLFDYDLGSGTGLDLLKKAHRLVEDMPVILLTGMDSPQTDEEALRLGAADYLCKIGLTTLQLERTIRYARKQTETMNELRRTTHLLNSVLSSLPVVAGRIDSDGSILEMRGQALRLIGLDNDEFVGVNAMSLYPEKTVEIRTALDGGHSHFTHELSCNGRRHYFDHYLRFDEARGRGAIGFSINVTARETAENERRRRAHLLQSILRNLPAIAGRIDANGQVIEAHGEGMRYLGLTPDHLLGRSMTRLFPQSRGAIASALAGGSATFAVGNQDTEKEWMVDFFVAFDSEQGRGATFFGRDLSERRRLERQLLKVSDTERQRIGADLHDGLGQHLTGLACIAAALADRLREQLPAEAEAADLVARLANEATQQSRALARGLSPVQLEVHGLASALEDLSFQAQRLHSIECTFTLRGAAPEMDHLSAIHLYRIAQEAIHNAVRHGMANRIRVALACSDRRNRLIILDNGSGFESRTANGCMGHGLRLMNYRANMLGGILAVRSQPGCGTRIVCDWPPSSKKNENKNDHSIPVSSHVS